MSVKPLTSKTGNSTADNTQLDSLIFRIAERDTEALAELYRLTGTSIYVFALSILKNTYDAEDVLHDCYLNIFSAAASYRSGGKPMAWIMTIARNLCLHQFRERSRKQDLSCEDWENLLPEEEALSPEDRIVIRECMNRLSDEERQIVLLHAVGGLKHKETAGLLQLPLSTVLSKYHRALQKLRKAL